MDPGRYPRTVPLFRNGGERPEIFPAGCGTIERSGFSAAMNRWRTGPARILCKNVHKVLSGYRSRRSGSARIFYPFGRVFLEGAAPFCRQVRAPCFFKRKRNQPKKSGGYCSTAASALLRFAERSVPVNAPLMGSTIVKYGVVSYWTLLSAGTVMSRIWPPFVWSSERKWRW